MIATYIREPAEASSYLVSETDSKGFCFFCLFFFFFWFPDRETNPGRGGVWQVAGAPADHAGFSGREVPGTRSSSTSSSKGFNTHV